MKKMFLLSLMVATIVSCTTVESGHKGVEVSWGGKTNLEKVYPEGMNAGLHWIWDDMVTYDVRETTFKQKYQFNDKNNMLTGVELALDYSLDADKVNLLHVKIGKDNIDIKIQKTLQSAAKEVIPQYTASELNLYKRNEAEQKISEILDKELPQIYVRFARVQLTDVDIPKAIAESAELTAKQQELNKLALEKAKEAENNFIAAEWDAKTKDVLSKPAMLELKKLEIEMEWAKKGISKYGNNNVFGSETGIIKGMK